jgi:hypothetical protein
MPEDLHAHVRDWLTAMGCAPVERPDPTTRWHMSFEYPLGTGNHMLVVEPNGPAPAVIVASVVRLTEKHLRAFAELSEGAQRVFLIGLRRALNGMDADFRLGDMDGPHACPRSFQVSMRRFPDGLGLDAFSGTVGAVFKAQLEGIWYIQEHLEDRPEDVTVFFDLGGAEIPEA